MRYQPVRRPEAQLLHQLWTLSRLIFRTAEKESGVAVLQQMTLRYVRRFPGTSPGTLAAELRLPPSVVAATLLDLEEQRLIRRTPHPTDGRRAMLGLTPQGYALLSGDEGGVERQLGSALAECSAEDREAFERVLTRLFAAVDRTSPEPPEAPSSQRPRSPRRK